MLEVRTAGLASSDALSTSTRGFQKCWKLLEPSLMVMKKLCWETRHLFSIIVGMAIPPRYAPGPPASTSLHLLDIAGPREEVP